MTRLRSVLTAAIVVAVSVPSFSYSSYAVWSSNPVSVFVNPANADVSAAAALSAVQYAMNVWNTQGGSSFRFQFAGTVSDTSNAFDNRNVVLFRNVDNGSTIATTYSWWDSSNHLLDSDIIVWDSRFTFYTGTSGCGAIANSAYLEDIATHELGHALGLNHSSVATATMYPSYSYCSQELRTLDPDDIAGVQALYPGSARANTQPTVVITSPADGAAFVQGTAISLAATASDAEDGTLSSHVQWTDNGSSLGSGSVLSTVLNVVGTHTFVASVSDSGGLTGSSQVSVTVTSTSGTTSTPPPQPRKGGGKRK